MPFVKLDCGILNSTLWSDRLARELFITSLLMAEPRELVEPMPQIMVGTLDYTGWEVPPGWYGFVEAAGPGIIHRAGMDDRGPLFAAAVEALGRLGEPEPESRTRAFDGRRLVRVDGGFVVLNFLKYREKDATAADRSRRWRERNKAKAKASSADTPSRVSDTPIRVIRHQAEAEAEVQAEVQEIPVPRAVPDQSVPAARVGLTTRGANQPNALPRDHLTCVVCGPSFRFCLNDKLFGILAKAFNGDDPVTTKAAIEQWVAHMERTALAVGKSQGDTKWLMGHFAEWLKTQGRVVEPASKRANAMNSLKDWATS